MVWTCTVEGEWMYWAKPNVEDGGGTRRRRRGRPLRRMWDMEENGWCNRIRGKEQGEMEADGLP